MTLTSTQVGVGPTATSTGSPPPSTLIVFAASAANRSRSVTDVGPVVPSGTGTRTTARSRVHSKRSSSPAPCSWPQNPSTRWASRHRSSPSISTPDRRTPRSRPSPVPGRNVGAVSVRSRKRGANRMRGHAAPRPSSACSSSTSGPSQSGSTKASLLTSATKSTSSRSAIATLFAGNPRLAPVGRISTSGNRRRSSPSLPSEEALSTTTISRSPAGQAVSRRAATQSMTWRPPL